MSAELIAALTREAEDISARHDFARLADRRRLFWSGYAVLPTLLLVGGMIAFFGPTVLGVLLQRQMLADADIPRSVQLVSVTKPLWPSGDEVELRYEVTGPVDPETAGTVRVEPDNQRADTYPLTFAERIDDNRSVYVAKLPPSSDNFTHRAWLGDGRSRRAERVAFEPRPVVLRVDAWVQLPAYVGTRPDGKPYEQYQSQQGDVTGLSGLTARVRIAVQKPVAEAKLILVTRGPDGTSEEDLPPIDMTILGQQASPAGAEQFPAEATFTLGPKLLAYKIVVKDRNGFTSSTPTRRGIQLAPDEVPYVGLLPERFAAPGEAPGEDSEVEGMPVPKGKAIRIAYVCRSPLGLSHARLVYRVNEGTWFHLPLTEAKPRADAGPFDLKRGAFANSGPDEPVQFYALPSPDPFAQPERLEGGGRFDFQTAKLTKVMPDGKEAELDVGDRVEFYVEAFDRNPAPNRAPGRSDARIKAVVSDSQFVDWVLSTLQSESRIRQLEDKQKGIFQRKE